MKDWIYQRWERAGDCRYYEARLIKDLLGDWVVIRNWGGIDRATGRVVPEVVSSYDEGVNLIFNVAMARTKKQYQPRLNLR